ncbi:hypothetical protein COW36_14750 [bacterium (Candidatus Blackallbacteria) CG17_big_fil_post_rev_8_21_14_2_50_48_46]|uniref:Uncharacterized protein n=1 Tax=bacterium (Candidatus Blackallbacteria) CG17_big_fil_post_rev_8_21_14_2_50_48_46 TaxID=2014261 RepID=A0A2M7G2G0_9BACT|nr:MAG: hypothetical protein COW64_11800 [bacterium (Candidatus Blackallbacteria) CG18_big_fil_WC_8_21_14_2_50_49_26]PIW15973.1 MAG: hypothetical protein COW36_14750 [bacterium (Candidatus Blackallbacteria) CG17_big_fil_post_rev_8_21_14_2_50_48_46]PIW50385.1 MAG: hypothetical protein COW20_02465 [bacterium (Candidatus Blackallbacteria) CG13_big_fil_rev_8_21_14_2_50_49_14]
MSGAHLPEAQLQAMQSKAERLGLELPEYVQMLETTLESLQAGPNTFVNAYVDPHFSLALNQAIDAQTHFLRHYALGD